MKLLTQRVMATVTLLGACALAHAQPAKPITLLVPFPPGGATDQLARVVAQRLTEQKGYAVVVDNRPGAGAQVAVNALKAAPADGSTLFLGDIGAYSLNGHLYSKLTYNVERDMQAVTLVGKAPLFFVVPASSPYKTVAEFIAAAKKEDHAYGSPGVGTGSHVAGEMLRARTGVRLTHIPYKGSAPALVELASGHLSFVFDPLASSAPFLKDGKTRALAVAMPTRTKLMPDLPTMAESGAPGVNFAAWFGFAVKSGTSPDLIKKYSKDIGEVMNSPDVVKRFADLGIEISTTTPEGFAQLIKADAEAYGPIIKSLNLSLD